MKYKFFPHTADIIFEAYGNTLEILFENSGLALEEIMVDLKTIESNEQHEITLEAEDLNGLLYDFLSELIFIKDTNGLLFNKFHAVIVHSNKKYNLFATCYGEKINPEKHKLCDDAKAITMHEFTVEQKNKIWFSRVLVDI